MTLHARSRAAGASATGRLCLSTAVAAALLMVAGSSAAVADPPASGGHGYNSIPAPLPGNLPSEGPEAYAFNELGNEITMAGGQPTRVRQVTVTLSSWGCQTGHWYSHDCSTGPGARFTEPITLNIYNPPAPSSSTPGSLITTVTRTFSIPYRPSADNVHCTGTQAGEWYDGASNSCFNGFAYNIRFPIAVHAKLPGTIVFGISYNTSDYGYAPYGQATACFTNVSGGGCPYDSLNIALSQDPTDVSVGSDPNPGTVWQFSSLASQYCDQGAAGTSVFRLDSPGPNNNCWSVNSVTPPWQPPYYVPAVRFSPNAGDQGDQDGQGDGGQGGGGQGDPGGGGAN
jgi:hypothetical protein